MRNFGKTIWLVLLASAGCAGETIAPQTRHRLDAARQAYQKGENRQVVQYTEEILRDEAHGEGAMQAHYLRGMAMYRLKEYDPAREDLRFVYDRTRNIDLRIKATDTLGELAYLRGSLDEADQLFGEVLDQTRDGERPADHARFRRGCIRQRRGQWSQADVELEKVTYHFPNTSVAEKARRCVRGRSWTIQVGSYDRKNNAAAAATRFQQAGMKTYIEPVLRDGKMVFLLQVGRWGQYKTAESHLPSVRTLKNDAFLHVAR
ncbi:MAG: SPOR domain-containing protein [Phycisphaerae bacterium]|nr:SPOR domain-containing protein [Phycisphaerae bacterium]